MVELVGSAVASIMVTNKLVVDTHMDINRRARFMSTFYKEGEKTLVCVCVCMSVGIRCCGIWTLRNVSMFLCLV